jgi:hypothetical protein
MRGRRHKLQVSTFPFLAVLLCAMGSLILVLLVMDRKAHKAAQARAQREAAKLVEDSARKETAHQAEREQLKQQALKEWEKKRDALHEKLTREQMELQLQMRKVREELQGIAARLHYEQDTTTQLRRKAQDERSRLQAEEQLLRTLRSNAALSENQSKESSQALRRMTLDLLQMEQVLKDLKTAKKREQKTFSVVPYHGRRGENRRPFYVECTADGVIFHPEHKAMPVTALVSGSDSSSSEVRAEVERRIAQQRQKLAALPSNVDKMPYLLLLLRPSGVTTYHLLQRALRGLPLDFGYEFIDEDWVLDFPADDERPSTQPWMIATKAPSRPASPLPVAASPPPSTNPRPLAGAPMGKTGRTFDSGFRGFRASEGEGNGSWAKGDGNPPGSATNGTSAGSGGTAPGMPGGGGISGSHASVGNQTAGSEGNPFGLPGGFGAPTAGSPGGAGTASSLGGVATGFGLGSGHGHPSAKPPTFPSEEGGMGCSGEGVASGGVFRGSGGVFPIPGSNSGSGSATGFPMNGLPAGTGSELPGLDPPRALAFGPGEGRADGGAGQRRIAGAGSTGNDVPGNGWAGANAGGPGIRGSPTGIGTFGDGGSVIARGNNFGDGPGSAFNGGGYGAGAGGSAMPGALGGGGYSSGASINYGSNPGMPGSGGPPSGTQFSGGGSPGGQALAGMSMPGALGSGGYSSGASINYGSNPGMPGSGGPSSAAQFSGGGSPGGQALAGMPMPGGLDSGGYPTGTPTNSGPNSSMPGSGSISPGSGQALDGSGSSPGTGGTGVPNAQALGGSSTGNQLSGAQAGLGNQGNLPNPSTQGAGDPSQRLGGAYSGTASVIGGSPSGQAATGTPSPANGRGSSDVVIFIDPLTGQPTNAPRPAPPPDDGSADGPPPEETDGNRAGPRIRVVPVTSAMNRGDYAAGGAQAAVPKGMESMPSLAPPPRRPPTMRPAWVHGGRDWTIYVECRADHLVLYPSQRTFTLAQAISDAPNNPLIQAIRQMIDRRQSSRRSGEPPYHPQVCLLVRPDHIRTFLTIYPALEALPVPKMRRNLDADDDVISIVTGAVP